MAKRFKVGLIKRDLHDLITLGVGIGYEGADKLFVINI